MGSEVERIPSAPLVMSLDWRIYYDNGSIHDSKMGIESAPAFGVIAVVSRSESVGRVVVHKWNWYYYNPEFKQFWGIDIWGIIDRLLHRLPLDYLLQGRTIDSESYRHIIDRACNDSGFPLKSGYVDGESPRDGG